MSATNSPLSYLECEYCVVIDGSVRSRKILTDYHADTYETRISCHRCAENATSQTYRTAGINLCDLCLEYREDVEVRSVFVNTMQEKEDIMCCMKCEDDRLMSV